MNLLSFEGRKFGRKKLNLKGKKEVWKEGSFKEGRKEGISISRIQESDVTPTSSLPLTRHQGNCANVMQMIENNKGDL